MKKKRKEERKKGAMTREKRRRGGGSAKKTVVSEPGQLAVQEARHAWKPSWRAGKAKVRKEEGQKGKRGECLQWNKVPWAIGMQYLRSVDVYPLCVFFFLGLVCRLPDTWQGRVPKCKRAAWAGDAPAPDWNFGSNSRNEEQP